MIKLIFILGAGILSCGPAKTTRTAEKTDTVKINQATGNPVPEQNPKDTVPAKDTKTPGSNKAKTATAFPACIKNMTDSFKTLQPHDRPQKIVEYDYKGKKVYYVTMPCCDFFNLVYDENCKLLGAPDGGFTGRGDGKLPDFFKEAKNEKLIWEAAK